MINWVNYPQTTKKKRIDRSHLRSILFLKNILLWTFKPMYTCSSPITDLLINKVMHLKRTGEFNRCPNWSFHLSPMQIKWNDARTSRGPLCLFTKSLLFAINKRHNSVTTVTFYRVLSTLFKGFWLSGVNHNCQAITKKTILSAPEMV